MGPSALTKLVPLGPQSQTAVEPWPLLSRTNYRRSGSDLSTTTRLAAHEPGTNHQSSTVTPSPEPPPPVIRGAGLKPGTTHPAPLSSLLLTTRTGQPSWLPSSTSGLPGPFPLVPLSPRKGRDVKRVSDTGATHHRPIACCRTAHGRRRSRCQTWTPSRCLSPLLTWPLLAPSSACGDPPPALSVRARSVRGFSSLRAHVAGSAARLPPDHAS